MWKQSLAIVANALPGRIEVGCELCGHAVAFAPTGGALLVKGVCDHTKGGRRRIVGRRFNEIQEGVGVDSGRVSSSMQVCACTCSLSSQKSITTSTAIEAQNPAMHCLAAAPDLEHLRVPISNSHWAQGCTCPTDGVSVNYTSDQATRQATSSRRERAKLRSRHREPQEEKRGDGGSTTVPLRGICLGAHSAHAHSSFLIRSSTPRPHLAISFVYTVNCYRAAMAAGVVLFTCARFTHAHPTDRATVAGSGQVLEPLLVRAILVQVIDVQHRVRWKQGRTAHFRRAHSDGADDVP